MRPQSIFYRDYMHSDAWFIKRQEAIERACQRCERCLQQTDLQVHHKHYRTLGREGPEDLEVVCEDCHRDQADKERTLGLPHGSLGEYVDPVRGPKSTWTDVPAAGARSRLLPRLTPRLTRSLFRPLFRRIV